MPPVPKTYYQILQVDVAASSEVIEAAYRRLARLYHPDLNKSSNATQQMQELNAAYEVLADARKRALYDEQLRVKTAATNSPSSNDTAAPDSSSSYQGQTSQKRNPFQQKTSAYQHRAQDSAHPDIPVICQGCGRSDASLRFAVFPFVISILLVTFRRGSGGLYCESCRNRRMLQAKLISLLFGWWGIPWGIFYTLGTLFESSSGKLDYSFNAEYLKLLGGYFLRVGNPHEAERAFRSSLELQFDPQLERAVNATFGGGVPDKSSGSSRSLVIVAALIGGAFVVMLVLSYINSITPSLPTSTPLPLTTTTPQAPSTAAAPTTRPTAMPTPTRTATLVSWKPVTLASGIVQLTLPGDWKVDADSEGNVILGGVQHGANLLWSTNVTGEDIGRIIKSKDNDPEFETRYTDFVKEFLERDMDSKGGELLSVGKPGIRKIGIYDVIFIEVAIEFKSPPPTEKIRMLTFSFDCGEFVCQFNALRPGEETFNTDEWRIMQQIVSSIKFNRQSVNRTRP